MALYTRILLAVDLSDHSTPLARRAQALAAMFGAELHLIHVLAPIPVVSPVTADPVMPYPFGTEQALIDAMTQRLKTLATDLGIAESACHFEIGDIKTEILRLAQEKKVDLIVLGSKERHGLSLLVDFTEDAVLHRAQCDVLAMRV